jgi:hypothetical protein
LNELRRQQAQRDREKRRQQMMEKRQHYEAFLQSLQSWEESLLDEPIRSHLRAMWEVSLYLEIAQFIEEYTCLCIIITIISFVKKETLNPITQQCIHQFN